MPPSSSTSASSDMPNSLTRPRDCAAAIDKAGKQRPALQIDRSASPPQQRGNGGQIADRQDPISLRQYRFDRMRGFHRDNVAVVKECSHA
jgi:hypothetical protein